MFKKINQFIVTLFVLFSVSFIAATTIAETVNTNDAIVNADTSIQVAPWETTGDATNLPIVQQLHNGNEIYYSINPNDNNTKYFQQAVAKWNELGVIKLIQLPYGNQNVEINMGTSYTPILSNDTVEGRTNYDASYNDGDTVAKFTVTNILINNQTYKYLDATHKRIIAMHELGHALGFAHNNRRIYTSFTHSYVPMIMNKSDGYGLYYTLGAVEQHALADHYGIQPAHGFENNNF